MKNGAPKIKDVARVARVSTATVSRALSKPETVAEETRKAVLDAAAKTGYRINLAARNLRQQKTGAVVVLVPNLGNSFFSTILAGIEATLAQNGLSVLIVDTKQPQVGPDLVFEYLHNSRADGIISLDGLLPDELLDRSLSSGMSPPLVYACEWRDGGTGPSVRADNVHGGRLAIEHLIDLGHSEIGHICGPVDNVLTTARRDGAMSEMRTQGIEIRDDWFFKGDFSLESGAAVARQLMKLDHRPSAIFCASDEMAFGLISELHRLGFNVPNDLSVVGFDDIDIAPRFIPALTTVRQPRAALGKKAADLLMDCIRDRTMAGQNITDMLPVELVVRESTLHRA